VSAQPDAQPTEPALGASEPVLGESEPVLGESEPVLGESEPVLGESEPVLGESEPVLGPTAPALGPTAPAPTASAAPTGAPLSAAFYERPVLEVARDLVGCVVSHAGTSGVIVETEAYHDSEPACHAYVGLTARTATLFGPPGRAYVYRSYGIHALLNAVCEPEGVGAAVLIRALEPLDGIELMRARRGPVADADLCNGPGKLTQALAIELDCNGADLRDGRVRIVPRPADWQDVELVAGSRIGITKAAELPWRFCARGHRGVSRPWPDGLRAARAATN
jgi:DNA-3-methyladenine glycosylase